ncbi:MAG: SURF1 family protein, partial [Pseudohongiellaceae bacterium]
MRKEISLGRLLVRINPLIAICVLLTLALLINLGFWQLGRAEEKRALQREMQARQLEPPIPISEIVVGAGLLAMTAGLESNREQGFPSSGTEVLPQDVAEGLENQSVTATGTYWNEASFVVAFQFFQGAPGFELITPFEVNDGGGFVLVSRGWIAPGPGDDGMPYVVPVEGEQTLTGQLHVPAIVPGRTQVEGEAWPLRFRRLDIARAAEVLERPLLPFVVRLAPGEPGVLARHWPAASVNIRTNIQYALQWFGMALVVFVITLLMSTN